MRRKFLIQEELRDLGKVHLQDLCKNLGLQYKTGSRGELIHRIMEALPIISVTLPRVIVDGHGETKLRWTMEIRNFRVGEL